VLWAPRLLLGFPNPKQLIEQRAVMYNCLAQFLSIGDAGLIAQRDGLRQTVGGITVLDRPQLERRTCECYAVVKKGYDRLLSTTMAS
jgi:hypothetical protein